LTPGDCGWRRGRREGDCRVILPPITLRRPERPTALTRDRARRRDRKWLHALAAQRRLVELCCALEECEPSEL